MQKYKNPRLLKVSYFIVWLLEFHRLIKFVLEIKNVKSSQILQ